jgi:crotonobetainyl-CoA:carnitine CoA-transferase CaiB-like acyl-CoA transferase
MAREKTGSGQYVDIAMSEGVLYMLSGLVSDVLFRGISAERGGNRLNGGAPYYNVYRTKDDKYFSIAAIEPWFWENLCRAVGLEDLLPHQDATGQKKAEVEQALTDAFSAKTRDEWFETLKDANISVGKVYSLEEALDDPHAQQRGMVLEIESSAIPEGKVRQVATSIHLSQNPGQVRHLGSVTGQHTANVLEELGFDAAAVADLKQRQVVQ